MVLIRRCRIFGCTESTPCTIGKSSRGTPIACSWIADDLCDASGCISQANEDALKGLSAMQSAFTKVFG